MDIQFNIGIPTDAVDISKRWLNHILADTYVMFIKARKFHWQVKGLQFMELHKHLQSIYEALDEQGDTLAERIRALDFIPFATLKEFLDETEIKETPGSDPSAEEMISELLKDFEHLIEDTRKAANAAAEKNADMATNNMLISFLESHEKTCWMLSSYLK